MPSDSTPTPDSSSSQRDWSSTRSFYDRLSGAYDALAHSSEWGATERGLTALEVAPGEEVLEIGSGTGHALLWLAERVGAEGEVHGIDVSEGMLAIARRRVDEAGCGERIHLRHRAVPPLPFPDSSLDAALASFTVELFPEEERIAFYAEARRVLRPGGRLGIVCMSTPAVGEGPSLLERGYVWMHEHFPHIVDCTPIDADRELRAAGYRIVIEQRLDIWTLPVTALVARAL